MAQKQIRTAIVLSGVLDPSFGQLARGIDQLGNKLTVAGGIISTFSTPIINAGKDVRR